MLRELLCTVMCGVLVVGLAGCSQNVETPGSQASDQETVTPTVSHLDTAQQGSEVYVYVINAPGKSQVPGVGNDPDQLAGLLGNLTTDDGTEVATSKAGYAQAGFTINVNTGSTTATPTGSATGTATATQNPSLAQTASPTQDVPARVGVTAQLGIAPGGINDMQGTGSAGEGDTNSDKTSTNDLRWAKLKAAADVIPGLLDSVMAFLGEKVAASQPAE